MARKADFSEPTKRLLRERAGSRCSNPNCGKLTTGPHNNKAKSLIIGEAAHICSPEEGGPRYNPDLSLDLKKSSENGIWLCRNCHKLIDTDIDNFPVDLLKKWVKDHEIAITMELIDSNSQQNSKISLKEDSPQPINELRSFSTVHIISNTDELRNLLKLPESTDSTFVQTSIFSDLLSNIGDFTKNQRVLLYGLPGTGKTTVLYHLLTKLISLNDIFLIIPFKNFDLKELTSITRSYNNILMILDDMNEFINIGEFEIAADSYKIGLLISESFGLIKNKIDFLNSKSILFKRKGNYFDSIEIEKQIIDLCHENSVVDYLGDSYYNISASFIDIKDLDKAEEFIKKTKEVENLDKENIILILILESTLFRLKGDRIQEESYLIQAKNEALELKKRKYIMYSFKKLGNFYLYNYDKQDLALDYISKAEEIAAKYLYIIDFIEILFDKASLWYIQNKFDEAEKSLMEVYNQAKRIKDYKLTSYSLTQLSSTYLATQKIEKAEEALHEALEINQKIEEPMELMIIYRNLGRIKQILNDLENLKELFDKSYSFYEKLKSYDDSDDSYLWLNQYANILIENNETEKAIKVFEQAIDHYSKFNNEVKEKKSVKLTQFHLYLNYYFLLAKKAINDSDVRKLRQLILNQTKIQKEMTESLNQRFKNEKKIYEFIGILYINISQCFSGLYHLSKDKSDLSVALNLIDDCINFFNSNTSFISDYQNKLNEVLGIKQYMLKNRM